VEQLIPLLAGERSEAMITGAELLKAGEAAQELDKAVGLIANVVEKLKAQPDAAALKLTQALGEIAKTLQVVEGATTEFLSLGIDQGALTTKSKLLLDISAGSLTTEVQRGRGHCHVIGNIYYTYLDKWFARVLKKTNDYQPIKDVFARLGNADVDLFYYLETLTGKLEKEAGDVLDLVVMHQEPAARVRVLSSLPVLQPLRKTMAKTMQTLYSVRNEFIDITGTV
jgi:hypothetical protein